MAAVWRKRCEIFFAVQSARRKFPVADSGLTSPGYSWKPVSTWICLSSADTQSSRRRLSHDRSGHERTLSANAAITGCEGHCLARSAASHIRLDNVSNNPRGPVWTSDHGSRETKGSVAGDL